MVQYVCIIGVRLQVPDALNEVIKIIHLPPFATLEKFLREFAHIFTGKNPGAPQRSN